MAREGKDWVLMAGSAYRLLPPHTCYSQRDETGLGVGGLATKSVCDSVYPCVRGRGRERGRNYLCAQESKWQRSVANEGRVTWGLR